ncbi:hypothetical protein DFH09DRAFT_1348001 [Mycena vulgaris]|nr:hypothetical protein DFH09DRAFT_1348001 [Mycena vulgaris]
MAAANGSIDDFQEIAFLVGRAENSSQLYLFVPVCWANLDPSGLPTPTELDILLESSGAPDLPKRPFLALQLIQILLDIPAAASIDLCAWAWLWMSFLVAYRGILRTSPAALNLYDVIFTFIGCIPVSTLAMLSGFRFLAFNAWKDFTATQDTKARGFPQLLIVLNADLETNDDARVEDYTEGAGGSIEDLASVYVTYTACDNLESGKLMPKTNLKSCGGCRTMYYCDRSCQRLDWQDHLYFADIFVCFAPILPLTRQNDWFIRALVQQTFQRSKHEIYHLRLDDMSSQSGEHSHVAQDYTSSTALSKPIIQCYDFSAPDFIPQDD